MDRITALEARVAALEQACAQAAASVASATQAMSVADVLMQSAGYGPSRPQQDGEDPEPSVPETPFPKTPPQGPACAEQVRPRTDAPSPKCPEPPSRGEQG